MNQCKQCGATLPQDSRYCLQCGTENQPSSAAGPEKDLDFLMPSLTGGLAMGVLSSIPGLNFLNALCCILVQFGGALTAWFLNKQRPGGLRYSDGALGGVLSGLIGAFIATLISIPVQMLMFTPESVAEMKTQLEQSQLPPEWINMIMEYIQPGFNLSRTIIGLLLNMVVFGLFSMIGGIIGVAILSRKKVD
jgi:hypothetical protein